MILSTQLLQKCDEWHYENMSFMNNLLLGNQKYKMKNNQMFEIWRIVVWCAVLSSLQCILRASYKQPLTASQDVSSTDTYLRSCDFENMSMHSSRERILCANSLSVGSSIRAMVWAYKREPMVKMCNWYSLEMFCKNLKVPGRTLVWYHVGWPCSWKWCTPWRLKYQWEEILQLDSDH